MSGRATAQTAVAALLLRFRNGSDGAAAVEFAFVAMPFLALIGGILQIAFQIWATQNFDHALQTATRGIFTGQFQLDNVAIKDDKTALLNALKTRMCGPTSATFANVFNCQNAKIDVVVKTTFSQATATNPIDPATGTWKVGFGSNYECAKPGSIVIVTAAVPFPSFFNLSGLNFVKFTKDATAGSGLLMSTAVFKTEPYQDSPCS